MNPKPTPVKVSKDGEEITKTHPSFGMVSFSRISGGDNRLFGSELVSNSFIRLSLTEGEEIWSLHSKRWHGRKHIVELDLSASQFAELLTSMNVGSGVPCTIRFRERDGQIPMFIDSDTLSEQIKEDLKADVKGIAELVKKLRSELNTVLAESSLSKANKARLTSVAETIEREITANMPFVLEQYVEATEKVTASAKAEVDAFLTHAATKLGFQSLQDISRAAALTEGKP